MSNVYVFPPFNEHVLEALRRAKQTRFPSVRPGPISLSRLIPTRELKRPIPFHVQGKRSRICWWCTWPARRASWSCLLTPKFARYRCTIATRRQRPPARPASRSRIHIVPGTPRRICVWPCRPSCTTATPTKPSSRTLWTGNTKAAATSKVILSPTPVRVHSPLKRRVENYRV